MFRALGFALGCGSILASAAAQEGSVQTLEFGVEEYVQKVLDFNENLQVQHLQTAINERQLDGEKGVFEPELVLSYDRVDSERPNTVEQQRNLGGGLFGSVNVFEQENNLYSGGIESLVPSGARVRLSYDLSDLDNNLQGRSSGAGGRSRRGDEYVSFAGLSAVQPLLKNFGKTATMIGIRLAAKDSDIAFQRYRRQLMQIVTTAEAVYWDLYYSQEQARFFQESVSISKNLLDDTKTRQEVGQTSELEVLEVESNLALRRTQLDNALQNVIENSNRLISLYSGVVPSTNTVKIVATDIPQLPDRTEYEYFKYRQDAFELNPDYRENHLEVLKQNLRIAYAKNQRLPQLDLKASYGLNGLGTTPNASFDDLGAADFPVFTVGIELRIPLGGGRKARNELEAARLRKQQALLTLKETETQMMNALNSAVHKVKNTQSSVRNYDKVVDFYENLLNTQMQRVEVGVVESQRVLETEEELLRAKNDALDSLVRAQRARLELEMVAGIALRRRGLELSQAELNEHTESILERGKLTDESYGYFRHQMRRRLEYNPEGRQPETP